MDPQVIAAILGLVGTVVGPVVAWKLTTRSQQRRFTTVSDARLHRIEQSAWTGYHKFEEGNKTAITLTFKVKGKLVTGNGSYQHSTRGRTEILLEGGFVSDDLLKLDYRNAAVQRRHFGTLILKMNADCSELEGGIMAYGRDPDRVYNGTISLAAS